MTRTVIIEPEAHDDLSRAFGWYEEASPGMRRVFIDAMREAVSRLTETQDGSTTVPRASEAVWFPRWARSRSTGR